MGDDKGKTGRRQKRTGGGRCSMRRSIDDVRSGLFWRAVLAECIGTALLVFVGCGSTTAWAGGDTDYAASVVQISFAFGLTLAVLIWVLHGCSGGHVNPALTLPLVLTRKISVARGVCYMAAQCVGGLAGAGLLMGLTPARYHGALGVARVNPEMTAVQGFGVEFMLTFVLVVTIFAMIDEKRGQGASAPIGVGFAAVCTHLMGIKFTGCNMNPARTLGPAIITGVWHDHWVYWCGPLLGGIAAGFLYDNVFAANASLRKTRDCVLAADYRNADYDTNAERYAAVTDKDDAEGSL